jgi:DNA repair protein SbcD/Mre11
MFRFIHAADPHLDSPLHGLAAYEGAPVETLRGATRKAFKRLIDLALEENVSFLLIAGDLYDGDWKDYGTGLFFQKQVLRLKEAGIPVYLIAGNHDAASVITKGLPDMAHVHWFSTRAPESKEVPNCPAVIHGQGFPNRAVPENLVLKYPKAVAARFNIGLLHTSLTGNFGHDTYAPCSVEQLKEKEYQFWALGHVHQPMVFSQQPWIGFAGNLQGRHVRELGARGCNLVTVQDDFSVKVEFQPLDEVRWQIAEVDLTGATQEAEALRRIQQSLAEIVAQAEERLSAVRILLNGTTVLHGELHRRTEHWRAQVLAAALEVSTEHLWIEKLKLATKPSIDVAALAERDDLTREVLLALEEMPLSQNEEIAEMMTKLPENLRDEVTQDFAQTAELREEIKAIILDALQTSGGSAA